LDLAQVLLLLFLDLGPPGEGLLAVEGQFLDDAW